MDIPWDQVRCILSVRRDIVSDTVRVDSKVTMSLAGEDAAQFRDIVRKALGAALDGRWDFKSVNRKEEGSGMEQMCVIATTRVPEHRTAGLVDRLRTASRPGLKLELEEIHYRPPHTEIKKVAAELRQELYQLAQNEADRLNELLPTDSIPWRVARVDVAEAELGEPRLPRAFSQRHYSSSFVRSMAMAEGASKEDPDFSASLRVEVKAKVMLQRLSLPLAPAAFYQHGDRPE